MRGGFTQTYTFIRDRSRAVRNDFTMQHETGPLAIECHDRCARCHILALHLGREVPNFDVAMEDEQLMKSKSRPGENEWIVTNCLQHSKA